MVAFGAFYEWRFGVPSHRFPCSLLQYYSLELLNLAPWGSCTSWPSQLCVRPTWGLTPILIYGTISSMEGGGGYSCQVRACVNSYFNIRMLRSMKGWQKKWFYSRNDANTSLPTFIDNHPVPLPTCGYGAARKDISKLDHFVYGSAGPDL
jgi:hypothetical protein